MAGPPSGGAHNLRPNAALVKSYPMKLSPKSLTTSGSDGTRQMIGCARPIGRDVTTDPPGDLTLVANITAFAVYVVFLAVNGKVIILRSRMPDQPRGFGVPGRIGPVPILPIVALATVLLLLSQLDPRALAPGAACAVDSIGAVVVTGQRSHSRVLLAARIARSERRRGCENRPPRSDRPGGDAARLRRRGGARRRPLTWHLEVPSQITTFARSVRPRAQRAATGPAISMSLSTSGWIR